MDRNDWTEGSASRQDIEKRLHDEVKRAVDAFEQAKTEYEKLQSGHQVRESALRSAEAECTRSRRLLQEALETLLSYIAQGERRDHRA